MLLKCSCERRLVAASPGAAFHESQRAAEQLLAFQAPGLTQLNGRLCDTCAESYECGEEMLLPVVNSPRVGMCAYDG